MANNSSWGNSGFSENSFFTLRNCLPDAGLPLPALTSASFLHLCCPGRGPAYLSLLHLESCSGSPLPGWVVSRPFTLSSHGELLCFCRAELVEIGTQGPPGFGLNLSFQTSFPPLPRTYSFLLPSWEKKGKAIRP